ncbi:hypothetical protein UFOVP1672_77 [uncultured Caudovirales phage]|uniref:Uncharacterized protein n=1 Tax=uncultured Caudovirales phage TaxID=2100421 RepID=A0A6J5SAR4_9CAUD|nr:hypothetical protein UFOVP988_15 [uncultured Caudovirales phage]CAB4210489.1 hypothetical protein UFOVP1425_15 [uncultured Caudovirales phage]CAB4223489.1 hypothetical protein UFOVP1672_77 [uncultured Caudovirales phage]
MAKRKPQDFAVYCTPERQRNSRELVIEPREAGRAGNVIMTGQRELQECSLDVLYRTDKLGPSKQAIARYNAGFWLRQLFIKTHKSAGVGSYAQRTNGSGEMSDVVAWNFKCYQEVATELGGSWRPLEVLCCDDRISSNITPAINGLDRLSELREDWIPDYVSAFYPKTRK